MMATRHRFSDAPHRVFIKGAPEAVLSLCAADGAAAVQAVRTAAEAMAERALRVLAFAVVDDDLLDGQVAGAVRDAGHGRALKAAGVQYILNPFDDAADHAAHSLAEKIQSKEGV